MTRILFLLPRLARGGAETLVVTAARALRGLTGWEVELCTVEAGYPLEAFAVASGLTIHTLGCQHPYGLRSVVRLRALLLGRKFDIIHSHLFPANLIAAMNRRFCEGSVIMTEHSVWNRRRRARAFRMLDGAVYRRFDKIVCVSGAVRAGLVTWLPELEPKTVVIHSGVAPAYGNVRMTEDIDILCVANLREAKGVDVLLMAAKLLDGLVTQICVAGDGPLRAQLLSLRDKLGLEEVVRFLGSVEDTRGLMRRSKIFALPSRWEGLPIALLEALGEGLAVVASDVGGVGEVVRHGFNGLLCMPGNPVDLADKLKLLMTDVGLRRRLGTNGHATILRDFSVSCHAGRLRDLYTTLSERRTAACELRD